MSTIVRVALAHHHDRSYDILIEPGLFRQIPEMLVSRFPRHSCAIISDSNVAALYGQDLLERIRAVSGNPCFLYTFLHGEERKTRETKSMLEDAMFHNQHDRKTLVIALGGGVTGDLAGYLAATYMRGVPFVQIPTSLLAQADLVSAERPGLMFRRERISSGPFGNHLVSISIQTSSRLFLKGKTFQVLVKSSSTP